MRTVKHFASLLLHPLQRLPRLQLQNRLHMFQKMGVVFALLVEPLRKLMSPQLLVWQQLTFHVDSVRMTPQVKPWIATSTRILRILFG